MTRSPQAVPAASWRRDVQQALLMVGLIVVTACAYSGALWLAAWLATGRGL